MWSAGTLSVNIPASGSTSHPTINAATNADNSNNIFVQDLLFDQYGHVTGITSVSVTGIPNVPNNILSSGDPISHLNNNVPYAISGSHISVSNISNINSNNSFVQDLLFDSYGHVTGVFSTAVTGITSGGSTGDIYLTGSFDTSTRNLTFSWNSGVSDIVIYRLLVVDLLVVVYYHLAELIIYW